MTRSRLQAGRGRVPRSSGSGSPRVSALPLSATALIRVPDNFHPFAVPAPVPAAAPLDSVPAAETTAAAETAPAPAPVPHGVASTRTFPRPQRGVVGCPLRSREGIADCRGRAAGPLRRCHVNMQAIDYLKAIKVNPIRTDFLIAILHSSYSVYVCPHAKIQFSSVDNLWVHY